MPNIASVLKEEIARLARKEVRGEIEGLKKASAQYRTDLSSLKKRVATLEKQLSRLAGRPTSKAADAAGDEAPTRTRFSAKGLATHRSRLGLTAADMGAILGVSAQTVYNWEAGKSKPRKAQLAAIANLRSLGKRQVTVALETLKASA
jgi:DNA-binding transcriptional regulator YiaG